VESTCEVDSTGQYLTEEDLKMKNTESVCFEEEAKETEEQHTMSRREYLLSLKKWSKVVIGSVLLGSSSSTMLSGCAAWSDSGGGWLNSGWTNYRGGTWGNSGGGWLNSGSGWSNHGGGGGGWVNSRGGGRGGGWSNSGGGGRAGWVNSGGRRR